MATHAEREARREQIIEAISDSTDKLAAIEKQAEKHNLTIVYVRQIAKQAGLIDATRHDVKRERNEKIVKAIAKAAPAERMAMARKLSEEHEMSLKYIVALCQNEGVKFRDVRNRKIEWAFGVVGKWLANGGDVGETAKQCKVTSERVGEIVKIAKRAGVVD